MKHLFDIPTKLRLFHGYTGEGLLILLLIVFYGFLNEVIGIVMILPVMELQNRNAERSKFTELIITVYNLLGMCVMLPTLICMTKMAFTLKGIITFIRLVTLERITTRLTRNLQTHVI